MSPANAYLSIDIGSQITRAWLFTGNEDLQYRIAATSEVDTTLWGGDDVQRGVWAAVDLLQTESGHQLLDHQRKLILGQNKADQGVAKVGVSTSAGAPIRTALIALTEKASLTSIRRLAGMFYCEESLIINLTEGLDVGQQLQSLMQVNPELIILAGGMENGASAPILSAVNAIRLFYHHISSLFKPQIIFSGNSALADQILMDMEAGGDLHISDNISPAEDIENLEATWKVMLQAFSHIRRNQIRGLDDLLKRTDAALIPSAFAINRMIRYLNLVSKSGKGVMALNVGSNFVDVSAAKAGKQLLSVNYPQVDETTISEITQWSAVPMEDEITSYYLQNKRIHPSFLPSTLEDLAIEQAWTRVKIIRTLAHARHHFPDFDYDLEKGLVGKYEPIIISGSALDKAPTLGQTLLMALDGIQPSGITTLLLDRSQVLVGLGTIASEEPLLPVQVLDAGVLENLGTVVCAQSDVREGALVVKVEIVFEQGERTLLDVRQGEVKRVEITEGTPVRIYLAPEVHTDIGMGERGLGGWISLTIGKMGLIIDARGRPIQLPDGTDKRSQLIKTWLWELGG